MTLLIAVVVVWVTLCAIGYLRDLHIWNGGICRENGIPWEHRDTDSQGGHLLKAGDIYTWLNGWVSPN